jgi:DNA-binding CsgD family transcriptional regulator
MWWTDEQLGHVDAALSAARDGRPTVLAIVGEAGLGKTTLLSELLARAGDFDIHYLQGEYASKDTPFSGLRQLIPADLDGVPNPFQAAQSLRAAVDADGARPVLIAIDDAQWVDSESVEAVSWLVRRAQGDRILVVAAARLRRSGRASWNQLISSDNARTITLTGLDSEQGRQLSQSLDSAVSDELAARLFVHTGGSPLYIQGMLREYDAADLEARDDLPAPLELAQSLAARVQVLSSDAEDLLQSVAVLGPGWVSLPVAAEVAGLAESAGAAELLAGEGLLEQRRTGVGPEVRVYHAAVRAAIYDSIAAAERARLHRRAAAEVADPAGSLLHRLSAVDGYDDGLADELAAFAWTLHLRKGYRESARFLRRASSISSDPEVRERRWLDALFDATLARDVDDVEAELSTVAWAHDEVRRALVQGFVLVVRKRWMEASQLLEAIDSGRLRLADDAVRYRVLSLVGWTRLVTGVPEGRVLPVLEEARAIASADPGFTGYLTFAYAMARHARAAEDPLAGGDADVSPYAAVWRGSAHALTGEVDAAVRELESFTARIDAGLIDMGDGIFHALLGFALWIRGDWRRASIPLGLAEAARFGGVHPMVQAILPLRALISADRAAARELIARSRDSLKASPWPQAIVAATIVDTFVLRLTGSDDERRAYRAGVRRDFGTPDLEGDVAALWLLHAGFAAVWSGDDAVDALIVRLRAAPPSWSDAGATWLAGLAARSRGDVAAAVSQLGDARGRWPGALRLHAALLADDLADVYAAVADEHASRVARAESAAILIAVGAAEVAGIGTHPGADDVLVRLSDRERDVLALLTEGLSYAQIAKELYVTRSTVAFHLSNIYAKTGTTSRHELVQSLRSA